MPAGMSDNVLIGILTLLGVALTAVFTWLYQRKHASASLLKTHLDDSFARLKHTEELLDKYEAQQAAMREREEVQHREILRLRDARHEMAGKLQEMQSRSDEMQLQHKAELVAMQEQHRRELEEMQRKHQQEIAERDRRIQELTERVAQLEQRGLS